MNTHVEQHVSQFSIRLFAAALGWYLFGLCTGAVGMVWQYESKPTVTVEQDGARGKMPPALTSGTQQARDAAPPLAVEREFAQFKRDQEARFARQEQRNKEQAFALRKLQGVKQTWDVQLGEVER